MRKKSLILYLTISSFLTTFGQDKYLEKGNEFLNNQQFEQAEQTFREGIKSDSTNLIYKCQLGLALMNQGKNDDTEKVIINVLKIDSLNVAALWYGGINSFTAKKGDFRKAIMYFEKSYPLIDKSSGQFFGVNYFIAKSYRNLLYTEGISFEETNRMLETYKTYTKLQPDAEDYQETTNFIKYIEEKRPPKNVKNWVLTNSQEDAVKIIKKQIKEK